MTIYCVGRNYVKHAHELGNEVPQTPLIFLKAESSLRSFSPSPIAFADETFHYEAELVLHIGRDYELGETFNEKDITAVSLGIDLTRREIQNHLKSKGLPWTLAKSFAGSAIIGRQYPYSGGDMSFELSIEGEIRQRGETQLMIFSFTELGSFINTFSPLKKGDLIFTGTPEGVGEIKRGQHFEMRLMQNQPESGML